jgi:hypothetical protein
MSGDHRQANLLELLIMDVTQMLPSAFNPSAAKADVTQNVSGVPSSSLSDAEG